jgi:glycosyltransferase involved in cell wall biosynthesis
VGGNSEAVLDGECGIVVPPHDPQRLAEALISLANDAEKRARYGEASRRRIGEHFSIEACAANYDTLYRDLLARRADRS